MSDITLAQWMETHMEWVLETYSEDRSEVSVLRSGEPVYLNRKEALAHARSKIGVRAQQSIVGVCHSFIELIDAYVEGGDEGGVIMGRWKIIKTWAWKAKVHD